MNSAPLGTSYKWNHMVVVGLPWWLSSKESACQCRRHRFDPWVRNIPWRRKRLPTLVFLPGKSYGQGKLAGYSLCGCKKAGRDLATKQEMVFVPLWLAYFTEHLPVLQHVSECPSFSFIRPNNTPLNEYTEFYLFVHRWTPRLLPPFRYSD